MTPRTKRIAKVIIAVLVIVGLGWATHKAIGEWNTQRDAVLAEIADLDRLIERTAESGERTELMRRRNAAVARVPSLSKLSPTWLALAAVLYALGLLPGGMVLHESARVLGYRVSVPESLAAQIVGHLGKYVPGKAMVVVIRAGRLHGSGVPAVAASAAVFLETILMMAVGAAMAGALIFFLPVPRWIAWAALLGGMAATVPTFPPLLRRVVARIGARPTVAGDSEDGEVGGNDAPAAATFGGGRWSRIGHDWRFFGLGWWWQLCSWGLIGGSFACVAAGVPGGPQAAAGFPLTVFLIASVAAIALAMVAGFVSLLPGGAGVRELTLTLILGPVVGQTQALLAAILARGVFLVVEVAAAAVVTWAKRPAADVVKVTT